MKKKKVLLLTVAGLILSLTFSGCSNSSATQGSQDSAKTGKPITLRLGHNSHAESFTGKAVENWAKLVSEKTDGGLIIDIYPQDQLGSAKEVSEQVALGSVDLTVQGMNAMVNYGVEEGYLTKVPFLFRTADHALQWWSSPDGQAIMKKAEKKGVKILGFGLNRIPRQFLSKEKPINNVEDIKNMKVRAGDTATNSALKVLKAVPTNISLNEMYTAMSQGVIEAIELPFDYFYDYSLYEVSKYMTLTNHTFDIQWVVINQQRFDSLPEEYQQVLVDTIPSLIEDNNKMQKEVSEEVLKKLGEKLTIIETDRTKWEDAIPSLFPELEKTWPSTKGLYEKIRNMK